MMKEMVRDQLTKNIDMETLLTWMINYNPMMVQTGIEWDSKTIKELVFYTNQDIASSSDVTSIAGSTSSYRDGRNNAQSMSGLSSKRRRNLMGPYSQFIGREVGGVYQKELHGTVYTWGTDQHG